MTDRQQLLALYRACFPEDPPAFWEWIFDRVYRPENTLNIRENNRIIASLQMIPCTMRYEGHDYPAHYIYAASTLPQRQGRGLMADLLKQAAERGRQKGHVFSVLITQEDSLLGYYDRFDYEDRFVIGLQQPSYMALEPGQNCRRAVEEDIASNPLWVAEMSTYVKGILSDVIEIEIEDFDYFLFYNITDNEYNQYPNVGNYDCVFMAYNMQQNRLILIDDYKITIV